ncbi:hypothetical protein [Streptomyces sp. NRRL S-920]|uniref:hypothetical protein n=1 Tax=Streptomyces sp. NRRL S-920 TaxID=1463921 RepID=UPI0004C8CED5|nr:hypothetical protein [Streptomyces sp. NRRL S-920]
MVTSHHEASHRIFQERPEILGPVFGLLGIPPPAKAVVEVLTPDTTEIRPIERRVDSVLRVEPSDGRDSFLLAIEAQGRRDADKARSWAYYVAYLQAKYDLPVLLLVVCQDKSTANWAAGPFTCGALGWTALTTHPLVLGPENVPVITDPSEAARDLAMAAFSALTHGRSKDAGAILEALARALRATDKKSADYYSDLLDVGLGNTPAAAEWRELMTFVSYFPGRGTFREEAYLEGKEEGRAEGATEALIEERVRTVIHLLEHRLVPLPGCARERITTCTDPDTLARWQDLAFTVHTVDELFAEDTPPEATA